MDDDTEGDQRLPHRRSQLRSADVSTEILDKLVLEFSNNSQYAANLSNKYFLF